MSDLPVAGPRLRLWMKLFAIAAVGVVLMHAVHLTIGVGVSTRALATEQEVLGRSISRLVAEEAVDPLLVGDPVTLQEIVARAATGRDSGVAYCFIERDGRVVASSFVGQTPPGLVTLRGARDGAPIVVRQGAARILDLAEPVLGGQLGRVRLGLSMEILATTRRQIAIQLGLLAVAMILAGLAAALLLGRSLARPVSRMLSAADSFDPARDDPPPTVVARTSDEIAVLADRFNRMMLRLRASHLAQVRAQQEVISAERLAALGSLVAGVAHEVNNPLAGLKNCVQRLERPDLPPPKRREYLALMREGLERIEEVVKRLLDFARPHPAALSPLLASDLAREGSQLVGPLLRERGVRCDLEVGPGADGPVLADRRLATQALLNLLLNAAYVTPAGGRIAIRVLRRDGLRGIAVADAGPGIPVEIRDRILDPFFTTKPEGQGTGLGLSVTRSIVDAHGGELTFDFPAGGGTQAAVWLRQPPATPPGR